MNKLDCIVYVTENASVIWDSLIRSGGKVIRYLDQVIVIWEEFRFYFGGTP